jgi:anti-sigma factor RsiW
MSDIEIRELVARYLESNDIAPQELADRLENESWELTAEPVATLAATVLRLLAEHDNGDWTESELKERLGGVTRNYWLDHAPKTVLTGAASTVTLQDQRPAAAGRWRVAESV